MAAILDDLVGSKIIDVCLVTQCIIPEKLEVIGRSVLEISSINQFSAAILSMAAILDERVLPKAYAVSLVAQCIIPEDLKSIGPGVREKSSGNQSGWKKKKKKMLGKPIKAFRLVDEMP